MAQFTGFPSSSPDPYDLQPEAAAPAPVPVPVAAQLPSPTWGSGAAPNFPSGKYFVKKGKAGDFSPEGAAAKAAREAAANPAPVQPAVSAPSPASVTPPVTTPTGPAATDFDCDNFFKKPFVPPISTAATPSVQPPTAPTPTFSVLPSPTAPKPAAIPSAPQPQALPQPGSSAQDVFMLDDGGDATTSRMLEEARNRRLAVVPEGLENGAVLRSAFADLDDEASHFLREYVRADGVDPRDVLNAAVCFMCSEAGLYDHEQVELARERRQEKEAGDSPDPGGRHHVQINAWLTDDEMGSFRANMQLHPGRGTPYLFMPVTKEGAVSVAVDGKGIKLPEWEGPASAQADESDADTEGEAEDCEGSEESVEAEERRIGHRAAFTFPATTERCGYYQTVFVYEDQLARIDELAAIFELDRDGFLRLLTARNLPGHPRRNCERAEVALTAGDVAFACFDPELAGRIERTARARGMSVDEFVAETVGSSVDCREEDMVVHPQIGELLADNGRDLVEGVYTRVVRPPLDQENNPRYENIGRQCLILTAHLLPSEVEQLQLRYLTDYAIGRRA